MSWEGHTDRLLLPAGGCTYAAIVGLDGALWGQSFAVVDGDERETFQLGPDSAAKLANIIKNNDQSVFGTGFKTPDVPFLCVVLDEEVAVFKGKGDFRDHNLVVSKSKTAMVVGYNPNKNTAPAIRISTEFMANYLTSTDM